MTTRQRKRLTLSCTVAVFLLPAAWYAVRLSAQPQEAPALVWRTPAQASQAFLSYLFVHTDSRESYFRATGDERQDQTLRSIVSQKSFTELKESGVNSLLNQLRNQLMVPRWEAESGSGTGGTGTTNAGNSTVQMRAVFDKPVVCVQEGEAWRVDVVATFARWNSMSDQTVQQLITRTRENSSRAECQSNLKQIGLGMLQYVQDYDEMYPPANKWSDVIQPYVKSERILHCPSLEPGEKYGYAMNWRLSRKGMASIESPAETVALYESSVLKRNHSGEGKDLAFRHFGGANYAYTDGHVKWISEGRGRSQNFLLSFPR
jgi:prepilin-type processing-associated H-X9-DG protein